MEIGGLKIRNILLKIIINEKNILNKRGKVFKHISRVNWILWSKKKKKMFKFLIEDLIFSNESMNKLLIVITL